MEPIVQVGKAGVNESVLFSLQEALQARELVKVRVLKNCLDEVQVKLIIFNYNTWSSLCQFS